MAAVHDVCRQRLLALQARWLELYPAAGKGTSSAAAALPQMSRERLAEAILAAEAPASPP